jgi:radical SAM protein with 4Fe4S-binding SPASM domain
LDDVQIRELYEFVRFLVSWYRKLFPDDEEFIVKSLGAGTGFNILSSPFTTIGRGFGCSLQSCLTLRLGDLTAVPCHRQAYRQFESFRFIKEGGKIVDIEGLNVDYYLTAMTARVKDQPYCETCLVRHLCSGGCPGSQFEATGDSFTPIPSVCKLLHTKLFALLREYKQIGILGRLLGRIAPEKRETIQILMEEGMV